MNGFSLVGINIQYLKKRFKVAQTISSLEISQCDTNIAMAPSLPTYRPTGPNATVATASRAPPPGSSAENTMRHHGADSRARCLGNRTRNHGGSKYNASRHQSSAGAAKNQGGAGGDGSSGHWGRASNQQAHYHYQHQNQHPQQNQQQRRQQQQLQLPSAALHPTPISSLDLALRPRYFAELTQERATLLDELQRHDQDARDLIARLAAADDEWASYGNGGGGRAGPGEEERLRRQCERQRALLRRRVELVVNRERAIMTRVGELSVEIQCRERWLQARGGRDAGQMGLVVNNGGFLQGPPPPLAIPHPPPSSPAQPPWPPGPGLHHLCNCKQCTRAPQHQSATLPILTGQELDPTQLPTPSYLDYVPVSAESSNNAWRSDGWAEDRLLHQSVPQETYGEHLSPSEKYTIERMSRRQSLP